MRKIIFTLAAITLANISTIREVKGQNLPTCPKPLSGHYLIRVVSLDAYKFVRSQLGDAIRCSVISNGQLVAVVQAGNTSDRATAQRYLALIKSRYDNAFLIRG